jgi:hypothetical protein
VAAYLDGGGIHGIVIRREWPALEGLNELERDASVDLAVRVGAGRRCR